MERDEIKGYRLVVKPTARCFDELVMNIGYNPNEAEVDELILNIRPDASEETIDKLILGAVSQVGSNFLSVTWEVEYEEE